MRCTLKRSARGPERLCPGSFQEDPSCSHLNFALSEVAVLCSALQEGPAHPHYREDGHAGSPAWAPWDHPNTTCAGVTKCPLTGTDSE